MGKPNPQNLNPCNSENARERQLKSAEKRKENNAKKKLMSQIYAEFLEKVLARSDSSSVSLMREIREGTEGTKMQLSGEVTTKLESPEDRIKLFEDLMQ